MISCVHFSFGSSVIGKVKFDFMEALLAVCITGVGLALRTAFPDSGMPDMRMLMEEWYLAVCAGAVLVHQYHWKWTKEVFMTYSVLTDSSDGRLRMERF